MILLLAKTFPNFSTWKLFLTTFAIILAGLCIGSKRHVTVTVLVNCVVFFFFCKLSIFTV